MDRVAANEGETVRYAVYSRIKESRTRSLTEAGWLLVPAGNVSRNSADNKIKLMIEALLETADDSINKIIIITEDKGFRRIAKTIIERGIGLEIICGSKNPAWIDELRSYAVSYRG
jgi:hypothetical protein